MNGGRKGRRKRKTTKSKLYNDKRIRSEEQSKDHDNRFSQDFMCNTFARSSLKANESHKIGKCESFVFTFQIVFFPSQTKHKNINNKLIRDWVRRTNVYIRRRIMAIQLTVPVHLNWIEFVHITLCIVHCTSGSEIVYKWQWTVFADGKYANGPYAMPSQVIWVPPFPII